MAPVAVYSFCSLFVAPIVCVGGGSLFCSIVLNVLSSSEFCNHEGEEERTYCFTSLCSCCHCSVSLPCTAVGVGLWYMILAFPDSTRLLRFQVTSV